MTAIADCSGRDPQENPFRLCFEEILLHIGPPGNTPTGKKDQCVNYQKPYRCAGIRQFHGSPECYGIEIRIEGHTDSDADYYYNMKLSQDRTRSVLEFVLENTEINLEQRNWIQSKLTANGLSFSRPIADNSTELGKGQNRRVEFRIRTNAEKQIDEILKYNTNE